MALKRRGRPVMAVLATGAASCAVAFRTSRTVGPSRLCRHPTESGATPRVSAPGDREPTGPMPVIVSMDGFLSDLGSPTEASSWHEMATAGYLVEIPVGTSGPQR